MMFFAKIGSTMARSALCILLVQYPIAHLSENLVLSKPFRSALTVESHAESNYEVINIYSRTLFASSRLQELLTFGFESRSILLPSRMMGQIIGF